MSNSPPVHPLELRGISQAHTLATRHPSHGQALAPPAASGGDHPASPDRAHTVAKTVGLRSLATVRLISTLHRTPLRVLEKLRTILASISEPPPTIQPPPDRKELSVVELHPNRCEGKCWKTALMPVHRCTEHTGAYRDCGGRGGGSNSSNLVFQALIHKLWISLWINM